ncbi:uncharacterized protein LOC111071286 [Drosophila obscura]|uniref:uncharacterized protein LOC111071286 n=1 Tax=Drosophila obscura TaxID=7282 RepID=UPI001BB17A1D|nr:uncharacterized protein LOC111071286 [Drosophila obscura]XP_041448478.1 uncharacterized protein LOC111071286 [Drosophila obscura]
METSKMSTKRKVQEKAQAAADQNVRQSNNRPSRPRTFEECMQAVESEINELNQMMEEFKKSRFERETKPRDKNPRKATKRKATNAETRKPANTQERKATSTQVKKPRNPHVQKPTQAKEPTTGQAKKPRKPRVTKLKSTDSTEPTISLDMGNGTTGNGIAKMDQHLDQTKSFPVAAPAKTKSSKSEAPSKIKKEPTSSQSKVTWKLEKEPKSCKVMATKVEGLPYRK